MDWYMGHEMGKRFMQDDGFASDAYLLFAKQDSHYF